MRLYRPVGMKELELVYNKGMKEYPPRLPDQPIFYPVLNFQYAAQIAKEWNTKSGDFAGYVTEFDLDDRYSQQFESHIVGSRIHEEWWVPAGQLSEFNGHITNRIMVTAAYFGTQFIGHIAERFNLKGRNAVEQFTLLDRILDYSGMDFIGEVNANNTTVFLNYAFWIQHDFTDRRITLERKQKVIEAINLSWSRREGGIPLPVSTDLEKE